MADPATMTDDELKKVVETGIEPDEPEPTTPDEPETPEEPAVPAEPETPEEKAEEPAPEPQADKPAPGQPSRRETLRIQDVLRKYGPPTAQTAPKQPDALNYQEALNADPEVIKQLEDDRTAHGSAQFNAGLDQAKFLQFSTRLEIDRPQVDGKYKFLDEHDKENFDPVRADAMNMLYLQATGYEPGDPNKGIPETVQNPNIRYRDFVEAQMEFAEALLSDRQVESSKNIAKQAATTGLRPDGSSAKRLNLNQSEKTMSIEELYAAIGQTPPK